MSLDTVAKVGLVAGGSVVGASGLLYMFLRSKTDDVVDDVKTIFRLGRLKRNMTNRANAKEWTIVDFFNEAVKKYGDAEALYFVDANVGYTFREVDEITNQIAHWAISEGLKTGDVAAVLLDNRPEFLFTWLGLAKAGVISALINFNLTGRPLIHSLTVCNAKHFIIGAEHYQQGLEAQAQVPGKWYSYGGAVQGMKHIDPLLVHQPQTPPPKSCRAGRKANDHALYIYTSGTTGNPKASIITNLRFYGVAGGFGETFCVNDTDRIYCALPLYHSAGGMAGLGMSWYSGACLVMRSKFSATRFWTDVKAHRCTAIQYIGELARYLLAQPPTPEDQSNIRIAIGNGLRADVWTLFQERFKVKQIGEFYGATEGNAALVNYKGKVGAVGYISPLVKHLMPMKIVKFDIETEEPIRGPNGFCIECAPGEPGELIALIDDSNPTQKFVGYTDKKATEKKILYDAFVKGDRYFRSGDLLKADHKGYYYFVDRIGDTFRWKGENVATGEVGIVLSDIPGVREANVYGVSVPGHDGRAGMCTLVIDESQFSFPAFYKRVEKELAPYARPLFIRIQPEMEVTGTFKHKKFNLQTEGFNPNAIQDPLYFRDDVNKTYVRITPELYDQIVNGTLQAKL